MSNVKIVDVRSLQHGLGSFLEIRRRRKIIARIIPWVEESPVEPWPDLAVRLEALYPKGPVQQSASDILYGDRGD